MTFDTWYDVPENFIGQCFIKCYETYFLIKKNKKIVFLNGKIRMFSNSACWWYDHKDNIHRLDGPAIINPKKNIKEYWINGMPYNKQDYWNHPLVLEYRINKILEL